MDYIIKEKSEEAPFSVAKLEKGKLLVTQGDQQVILSYQKINDHQVCFILNDQSYVVNLASVANQSQVFVNGDESFFTILDEKSQRRASLGGGLGSGSGQVLSPMPGKVIEVKVKEGDNVEAGQGVVIVEAMKMQNEFKVEISGVVQSVLVCAGDAVESGQVLVKVDAA